MRSKIIILILCLILTGCGSKTYTITFNTDGGTPLENIVIKEGENIKDIELPVKDGYLFVSWIKDGHEFDENTPINEDLTLTATWIETPELYDTYTVIYQVEGNVEKEVVKENSIISKPVDPEKENHTFIGWYVGDELYDFNNPIKKDLVLEAKFELDTITVTYELDGGTGPGLTKVIKGESLEIPNPPTKEGYKFIKWTLNEQDFSFTTKIEEDITLKAIWEKIEYVTIEFDTNDGNEINKITIEKYTKINSLPSPIKEGYTFKYWSLNNEPFDTDTKIEENIILKAVYDKDLSE